MTVKIISIDDEPDIADNIAEIVSDFANCKAFYSSREASEYLAKNSVDLVITDIDMSKSFDIGGGERVLSEVSTKDVAVFVYTGGNEHKVQYFRELGAKQVVFKPNIEKLIDAVENFIAAKHQAWCIGRFY